MPKPKKKESPFRAPRPVRKSMSFRLECQRVWCQAADDDALRKAIAPVFPEKKGKEGEKES